MPVSTIRRPSVKPEAMLVNGTRYATLSIPDARGRVKTYHLFRKGNRLVKFWRRLPDGTTTTYKVRREDNGRISCSCKTGSYGLPCKHAKTAGERGIVCGYGAL